MSESLIGFERTRPIYFPGRPGGRRCDDTTALLAALVVVGLVSGWIAAVYPIEQSNIIAGPDRKLLMEVAKGPVYYAAHGLSICCVTLAGVLSALDGGWRLIDAGTRLALYILLLEACLWTAFSYTPDELLSSKIFGATGPFVWIALLAMVAGTRRSLWNYIGPTARALAYASSLLAMWTLVTLKFAQYHGASQYTEYTKLLLWLGGWTLLSATRISGWSLIPRLLPVICLIPVALCSQSRSLILEACLLPVLFVTLRAREKGSPGHALPILIVMCILAVGAAMVIYWMAPQAADAIVNGLNGRLTEDTRSGQYRDFFDVVPLADLVLGRGPNGTWYWRGFGEFQFFDNGYLWMLFIGGVPTLCCYVRIVVWPALKAVATKPRGDDAAVASLAVIWSICLTGLSVFILPGLDISNYLILLFVGRCHLLLRSSSLYRGPSNEARYRFEWSAY